MPEIQVRIIAATSSPLATLADARELPPGESGEIIVSGPVVTASYDALPEATALAKISSAPSAALTPGIDAGSPGVWHRTGDIGMLDAQGRLWFHGRKAERVRTAAGPLDTEPCERIFRTHPRATRCALIGVGPADDSRPALVAETVVRTTREARELARELRALALTRPETAAIRIFYFLGKFPVDVRHNAKIHRLAIARWAATTRGFASDPKR